MSISISKSPITPFIKASAPVVVVVDEGPNGHPRTLKEVSAKSNIRRKDIAKNCRIVMEELGIRSSVVDPLKCIVRVARAAELGEKTTRHAFKMMSELLIILPTPCFPVTFNSLMVKPYVQLINY